MLTFFSLNQLGATLSAKAGWSVSKFEAINPTVSCSPLKTGVKVCTVIQYIKTTTTTTKTTTAKTTTTTKKTTTTTKPTTTTAKSTTTTKPTTTTTKATTTTKPTTTTTKTSTTAKSSSTGSTSGCTKTYTVASGDSCWQIATNNGLQEPVFESYNPGIDCTALQIGQVVCVNTGSVASTIATTTTTKTTATTTLATSVPSSSTFVCSKTYTVISGDNCYAIATNLGMAEPVFESYNPGINCALLQVGQVVCTGGSYTTATKTSTSATATPTSTYGCTKTHVIGSTEYCYSIAQNANISLDQLLSYNTNLSCNNLKPGTSLCVAVGPNGGAFPIIPIYSCSVANTFAITFDDGPYKYTQELVNYLNNNSITATFFINGQNYGNIYDYKDFLISAYKSGHQIAHHTWSHANISTLTDDELRLEITQLEDAFLDILGVIPTYFRPPFGEYLDSSLKVLNSLGYKGKSLYMWQIDRSLAPTQLFYYNALT